MKWFMRVTDDGVGMHVGILPGYPASHGCIRMPSVTAELFYNHVKVGTRWWSATSLLPGALAEGEGHLGCELLKVSDRSGKKDA